jgi:hypothetical protein
MVNGARPAGHSKRGLITSDGGFGRGDLTVDFLTRTAPYGVN